MADRPSAIPDDLVLSARELRFAWPGSEVAILRGASLEVRRGERLLLTGPSGGGKSTLIAVLAGLRKPQSGLLLAAQEEALAICQELGLGPLLERMPAGLGQMVGETGWQLSQGERSRVFMARALLQGALVVVLDESLGALDPETFEKALDCLSRRAESVILVAHP